VLPDPEEDILKVTRWNDVLAQQPEVYHVCGAAHARQIVCEHTLTGHLPPKPAVEVFDIQEMLVSDEYPWMLRRDEAQLDQLADAIQDLLEEEYANALDRGAPIQFDA
jgi:hypothetical protein